MAHVRAHNSRLPFCRYFTPATKQLHVKNLLFFPLSSYSTIPGKIRVSNSIWGRRYGACSFCCKTNSETENPPVHLEEEIEPERHQFDINLAVILAGFAFEAYTTPPDNIGKLEVDAANCKTVFLSRSFIREIYDGQLFVKLKKGHNLPAMDPWGTSDPYVILQLDSQVLKSKTKWGTKEPTWNEEFTFNIKQPPTKSLQVAAWDANLVAPHKRMGNGIVGLEALCDGNVHDLIIDLEGMGGGSGGKLQLEIKYKTFDEIDEESKWWKIPFVSELLRRSGLESALKTVVGSESVQASEFVRYAFGQIKSINDAYLQNNWLPRIKITDAEEADKSDIPILESNVPAQEKDNEQLNVKETRRREESRNLLQSIFDNSELGREHGLPLTSDKQFWNNFAELINQNVVQKLGLALPEKIRWDGFDLLNKVGLQLQKIAEAGYIERGLATPDNESPVSDDETIGPLAFGTIQTSLPNIKKVTQDLLRQTDSVLGAVMVINATVSQSNEGRRLFGKNESNEDASTQTEDENQKLARPTGEIELDEKRAEEMKVLFSTAESAMEAWAMLATSLGHSSFIKSEFQKICFLDNPSTDTQVAIWRDTLRKRLVVAFRGTEQSRWKDLRTDLMLVPAGLNPERIGGDFKQEVQVHSGFLSAYDSVRTRLFALIRQAVGYTDDDTEPLDKWHVYVTGHSLGGALATLLALELSSSQLAKRGVISVTMYNFGSPRVGNRKFAEAYNKKVKDSWRVVNHRDIVPTVPRLMGYCHVAQPVYLAAGDLKVTVENLELLEDGYQGDVIGEYTPDVLVSEFVGSSSFALLMFLLCMSNDVHMARNS